MRPVSYFKSAPLALLLLVCGCGSGDDDQAGSSALASTSDFCQKCSECVTQPGFSEGYCTPFISNLQFDRLECNSDADSTQLDSQNVKVSELQGWTCDQFDDNE